MDIKKLLIGGIIGGILFFLLDWLVYGNLLMNFMKDNPGTAMNVSRAQSDMQYLYLAIGNLSGGFLLSYIFVRANVNSFSSGLVTAGVVSALLSVAVDVTMYGWSNIMSKKSLMADVLAYIVIGAVVGAIIGLINSKLSKPAA